MKNKHKSADTDSRQNRWHKLNYDQVTVCINKQVNFEKRIKILDSKNTKNNYINRAILEKLERDEGIK